jgi:hypothetical protein
LDDEGARLSHVHLVILGVYEGEENLLAPIFRKLLVFFFLDHGTPSSGKYIPYCQGMIPQSFGMQQAQLGPLEMCSALSWRAEDGADRTRPSTIWDHGSCAVTLSMVCGSGILATTFRDKSAIKHSRKMPQIFRGNAGNIRLNTVSLSLASELHQNKDKKK